VKDLGEGEADADPIAQLQGRVEHLLQRWRDLFNGSSPGSEQ